MTWTDGGPEKKRVDKKPERYFSSSFRQLLRSTGLLALPVLPERSATNSDFYIKLAVCGEEQGCSTQTPESWVNPLGIYDPGTTLWLEGKGQPEGKGDQQGTEAKESNSTLLSARVEEFNRNLRENPTDIKLWLDFVHFQVGLQRLNVKVTLFAFHLICIFLSMSLLRMSWPSVLGLSLLAVTVMPK